MEKLQIPVNAQNLKVLFKSQNRLFVKPDYCDLFYSEDDGKSCQPLRHKGKSFTRLFKVHDGSLYRSLLDNN